MRADGLLDSLACAGVGLCALSTHRQTAGMAHATICLDALQALEVLGDLPPQIAFHQVRPLSRLVLFNGAAIGMQAEEVPREALEGNHFMSGAWQFLIDNGVAKTQTDAHRLIGILLIGAILASQYFGYFNSFSRGLFIALATLKAYAGWGWWAVKPNKYTVMDYLTFNPGRLTNERYSLYMRNVFNERFLPNRRRLRSTTGINWLTRYLPYIFPAL